MEAHKGCLPIVAQRRHPVHADENEEVERDRVEENERPRVSYENRKYKKGKTELERDVKYSAELREQMLKGHIAQCMRYAVFDIELGTYFSYLLERRKRPLVRVIRSRSPRSLNRCSFSCDLKKGGGSDEKPILAFTRNTLVES